MARNDRLTDSQQRFVDEYLVDLNGTQAYRRAFPGASYRTAMVEGCRLLRTPKIRSEITAARKAQQQRTRVTADKVLREYARLAFSDVHDLFRDDGTLRPAREVPVDTRRAVQSVKVTRGKTTRRRYAVGTDEEVSVEESEHTVEYKLASKQAALDSLAEHLGLKQPVNSLEALLALLPDPALRDQVRQALADAVSPGGRAGGPGEAGGG